MVAILYKQTYTNKHKMRYGCYIIYTKHDMVAILYKQTQNSIWLLYYINKHKTRYGCYIIYTNTKYGCYII